MGAQGIACTQLRLRRHVHKTALIYRAAPSASGTIAVVLPPDAPPSPGSPPLIVSVARSLAKHDARVLMRLRRKHTHRTSEIAIQDTREQAVCEKLPALSGVSSGRCTRVSGPQATTAPQIL